MKNIIQNVIKSSSKGKGRGWRSLAFGAGWALTRLIISRPGTKKNIEYIVENALSLTPEPYSPNQGLERVADEMVALFAEKQINPNRIAIDGLPGSGKSSLAYVLGKKLHMDVDCLDYKAVNKPRAGYAKKTIYEHHRLFRTQSLDYFDVIIYLKQPVKQVKARLLKRRRGAYLMDILDFEKLKRVGDKAFQVAEGETFSFSENTILVKIRPLYGFKDEEILLCELKEKGIDATGRNKEERIFICVEGKAQKGFKAYLTPAAYTKDILSAFTLDPNKYKA